MKRAARTGPGSDAILVEVRHVVAAALALALASCGGATRVGTPAPQTLPASALPGLDSRARSLDGAALGRDAGSTALPGVLNDAGYVSGAEREFFGRTTTFDHVVARTLVFEGPDGAAKFLAWLRSHPDLVLGRAVVEEPLALGESPMLFSLGPCGCHGEVPTFFAAWRRGATVLWLLAGGPGATRATVDPLARELDQTAS